MALTDINFSNGERAFALEVPAASYSGSLADVLGEPGSRQAFLYELFVSWTVVTLRRKVR